MPHLWNEHSELLWPLEPAWDDRGDDLFCTFSLLYGNEKDLRINVLDEKDDCILHVNFRCAERICRVSRRTGGKWQAPFEFDLNCFTHRGTYDVHVRFGRTLTTVGVVERNGQHRQVVARFRVPATPDGIPCQVALSDAMSLTAARFTRDLAFDGLDAAPPAVARKGPGATGGVSVVLLNAHLPAVIGKFAVEFLEIFDDFIVALDMDAPEQQRDPLAFKSLPMQAGRIDLAALAELTETTTVVLWDARFQADKAALLRLLDHLRKLPGDDPWVTVFPLSTGEKLVPGLALQNYAGLTLEPFDQLHWFSSIAACDGRISVLEGPPVGAPRGAASHSEPAASQDLPVAPEWTALREAVHSILCRRTVHGETDAGAPAPILLHAWPVPRLTVVYMLGKRGTSSATARAEALAGAARRYGASVIIDHAARSADLARLMLRNAPQNEMGFLVCVFADSDQEQDGAKTSGPPAIVADAAGVQAIVQLLVGHSALTIAEIQERLAERATVTIGALSAFVGSNPSADPVLHQVTATAARLAALWTAPEAAPQARAIRRRALEWPSRIPEMLQSRSVELRRVGAAQAMQDASAALAEDSIDLTLQCATRACRLDPAQFIRGLPDLLTAFIDENRRPALSQLIDSVSDLIVGQANVQAVINCLMKQRLAREALAFAQAAENRTSLTPDSARQLCWAAFEIADRGAERRMLTTFTSGATDRNSILTQETNFHFRHGAWAEAADGFRRLLKSTPRDWFMNSRLVQCHIHLNELKQAETVLRQFRSIAPSFADTLKLEGVLACLRDWKGLERERNTLDIVSADADLPVVLRQNWKFEIRRKFDTQPDGDSIIAFFVARNEGMRLPFVLEYYRRMGVTHFVVLDNQSSDDTPRIAADFHNTCLIYTEESYRESRCAVAWFNTVMDEFGRDKWCLCLDADELLVFPGSDALKLPDLCRYLDSIGAEGLPAFMLDMYAEGSLRDARYAQGDDLRTVFRYFDPAPYNRWPMAGSPSMAITGGLRDRVFRVGRFAQISAMALQKIPLVKWRPGIKYLASTHDVTPLKCADISGVLLHYKYLPDFHARAVEEVQRGEHWNGASEYQMYAHHLSRHPDFALRYDGSREYTSPDDLLELGLLHSSERFRAWQNDGQRDAGEKTASQPVAPGHAPRKARHPRTKIMAAATPPEAAPPAIVGAD